MIAKNSNPPKKSPKKIKAQVSISNIPRPLTKNGI
jgi:hypothetical protein